MNKYDGKRKPVTENNDTSATAERRRLGRIIHDDRGSASVEWQDAPGDYERPVFRIEGTGVKDPLAVKNEETFNPYDRKPGVSPTSPTKRGKRDLRKLSEWVKMMREMEERKKRGED